jgi:hypothetical protein
MTEQERLDEESAARRPSHSSQREGELETLGVSCDRTVTSAPGEMERLDEEPAAIECNKGGMGYRGP